MAVNPFSPGYKNNISKDILLKLDQIKQKKAQDSANPLDYHNFMPGALNTNLPDIQTPTQANLNSVDNIGNAAMQTSNVLAANKKAHDQMLQEQRQVALQKHLLKQTQKNQPKLTGGKVIGQPITHVKINQSGGGPGVGGYNKKRWGANGIPQVSDINHLRPHAPIVTVSVHGRSFQVNRQVAPIFEAFLQDLWRHGYHFVTVGGYRSTIGQTNSNIPFSLHQLGFAIDVDAAKNPYQSGPGAFHTTLPPGVAALAAKYGLEWGGSWHHNHDPMHFGIAYGGVQ